jgi:archaellum component FlaC
MILRDLLRPKLAALVLFSGLIVSSCAANPVKTASLPESASYDAPAASPAPSQLLAQSPPSAAAPTAAKPVSQLIKTAQLELRVDKIEEAIAQVKAITEKQQGDILGLESKSGADRPVATLQIRVPQTQLDAALQAIKGLGTVKQHSIQAEDVADQIVDAQARLRNLKRTESNLLNIMDRSGSVADVLKVSQELSNTRSSIEQITAQVSDLQNRVAYSLINLKLESAIANQTSDRAVPVQLQETWNRSTQSLASVTMMFVKLAVWLLVYSPYLGIALLVGWYVRSRQLRAR